MPKAIKWFSYFALTLPLAYLAYLAFHNGLGANPAEKLNKELGSYTLIILLINLYWGCFNVLVSPRPLRRVQPLRRPLGVAAFVYALLHFVSYFLREGDLGPALRQVFSKTYLIFGFSALFVLLILAMTSNNWSLRKLKTKWKPLHRLVYLAFALITVHVSLIEKRSWWANKWTIFPMLFVYLVRVGHSVWRTRFKKKSADSPLARVLPLRK